MYKWEPHSDAILRSHSKEYLMSSRYIASAGQITDLVGWIRT